jgi:hypothetical protein
MRQYIYIYTLNVLEIFITNFILYIFKTIYNFKLSVNKNFENTSIVLIIIEVQQNLLQTTQLRARNNCRD